MTVLFCWCTLSSDILLSLFMQDLDNNGYIGKEELHTLLKKAGHDMPGYMVRDIIKKLDRDNDELISFDEFLSVRSSERRIPVWYRLFRTSRALGPGLFCLRPQRTSRSSNEQMCVFAPTCVRAQSWKTRTPKECGSEVAEVVLCSCVGFQLCPESMYSQFLRQEWEFWVFTDIIFHLPSLITYNRLI